MQVRAAGSILRTHAARGRRAVLAVNSAAPRACRVSSLEGDWPPRSELLAAAEAGRARPVVELIARDGGPAARALETRRRHAAARAGARDKLVQRALAGQGVSLVWIDSASFAGRPTKIEPELLRLQAAGVARRGRAPGRRPALGARGGRRREGRTCVGPPRLLLPGGHHCRLRGCGSRDRRRRAWARWWIVLLALAPALAPTLGLRLGAHRAGGRSSRPRLAFDRPLATRSGGSSCLSPSGSRTASTASTTTAAVLRGRVP